MNKYDLQKHFAMDNYIRERADAIIQARKVLEWDVQNTGLSNTLTHHVDDIDLSKDGLVISVAITGKYGYTDGCTETISFGEFCDPDAVQKIMDTSAADLIREKTERRNAAIAEKRLDETSNDLADAITEMENSDAA